MLEKKIFQHYSLLNYRPFCTSKILLYEVLYSFQLWCQWKSLFVAYGKIEISKLSHAYLGATPYSLCFYCKFVSLEVPTCRILSYFSCLTFFFAEKHGVVLFYHLTPNDPFMGRIAPLTSKRCILYIYSTDVGTEYFKHALYSPFFSLQNSVCFIMLTFLVPVLVTFYIQGVLKLKKNNSGAKGLICITENRKSNNLE